MLWGSCGTGTSRCYGALGALIHSFFRRLTAYNICELAGYKLGLFVAALRFFKLGESGINQVIEKLGIILNNKIDKDE